MEGQDIMDAMTFDKLQEAEFALFEARNAMREDGYDNDANEIELARKLIMRIIENRTDNK